MKWFLFGLGMGLYVTVWSNFLGKPTIVGIGMMLVGILFGIVAY